MNLFTAFTSKNTTKAMMMKLMIATISAYLYGPYAPPWVQIGILHFLAVATVVGQVILRRRTRGRGDVSGNGQGDGREDAHGVESTTADGGGDGMGVGRDLKHPVESAVGDVVAVGPTTVVVASSTLVAVELT